MTPCFSTYSVFVVCPTHSFECKQRRKFSIFMSSAQPWGICREKEANISLSGRIEMKEHLSWLQNWMLPLERQETAVVLVPLLSGKVKALTTDLFNLLTQSRIWIRHHVYQTCGSPSCSTPGQIMKSWQCHGQISWATGSYHQGFQCAHTWG